MTTDGFQINLSPEEDRDPEPTITPPQVGDTVYVNFKGRQVIGEVSVESGDGRNVINWLVFLLKRAEHVVREASEIVVAFRPRERR